jgi:hypothetical protein
MSELCLQIAADAIPDLSLSQVRRLCGHIARDRRLVSRLRWSEITLARRFVTAQFTSSDIDGLWRRLRTDLIDDPVHAHIAANVLVMTTGQSGWNDSRHLHPQISQVA